MEPDVVDGVLHLIRTISIHGLRVEPDPLRRLCRSEQHISIHGLRVEPDLQGNSPNSFRQIFQSTGSVWSPTGENIQQSIGRYTFQSTGSVWSPTIQVPDKQAWIDISIHGLRVEPDGNRLLKKCEIGISIHGLRVEPDSSSAKQ